ncbi:MAG: F0F1 ATP synthase subunit B [Alphaproteobacteria bacterium]
MFGPEFWVAAAFVIFVVLMWRPVGRMIGAGLDARARKIREELEEAVRLREEAQALYASYQRRQSEAAAEAEEILAHAREEAERLAKQGAAALEATLARREQQALDRIARAEQEAVDDVRAAAVDLALRATRELLAESLDDAAHKALIDDAVAGLDKQLH